MNKFLVVIILFVITIFSCSNNEESNTRFSSDPCELFARTPDSLRYNPKYEKPIITFPEDSKTPIFYSNEIVDIQWGLPTDLRTSELQIIELDAPFTCPDLEEFHMLNNNFQAGYVNQYVHYYQVNQYDKPITDSIFVAYRIRTTDIESPQHYSLWTDVKSFAIVPLSNLSKKTITVSYNFSFITEELNQFYYSGLLEKDNYRLNEIALDNGMPYDKIRLVRPIKFETNFVTTYENNRNPFSRIMIGFEEDFEYNKEYYPFEVFADVYPGSYEQSPVEGNLYQSYARNFFTEMNDYNLKVAYKLEDEIGKQHDLEIILTYEIFSDY
jgi:hypothetical protein